MSQQLILLLLLLLPVINTPSEGGRPNFRPEVWSAEEAKSSSWLIEWWSAWASASVLLKVEEEEESKG